MPAPLYFAIPGDIATRTGGYEYDRQLIAALRAQGHDVIHLPWPGTYPNPSAADAALATQTLATLPAGSVVLIDGLAYGALPALAHQAARRLHLIALVHHPLARETGLTEARRRALVTAERQALAAAAAVIVTSPTTAATLATDYGVPLTAITIARPGTQPAHPAPKTRRTAIRLLAVGALIPRKAYPVLLEALALVRTASWTCRIVGSPAHDAAEARAIAALRDQLGLRRRVRLEGEVHDTTPFFRRADVFVLASHYEGYGMAYAEALAHGLPVIGTTGGAIPTVVPPGAGILVPPNDSALLADALRRIITDAPHRARLALGAAQAATTLPGWAGAATQVAAVVAALRSRSNSTSVPS